MDFFFSQVRGRLTRCPVQIHTTLEGPVPQCFGSLGGGFSERLAGRPRNCSIYSHLPVPTKFHLADIRAEAARGGASGKAASPTIAKKNGATNDVAGANVAKPKKNMETIAARNTPVRGPRVLREDSLQQLPRHISNRARPSIPAPTNIST
jgi:hypothetical protein